MPPTARMGIGAHVLDFGFRRERYELRTLVSSTPDWIRGRAASRFSAFDGNTELQSLYVQGTFEGNTLIKSGSSLRPERSLTTELSAERDLKGLGVDRMLRTTLFFEQRRDALYSAAVGIDKLNNYRYWAFHPSPQRTLVAELKFDL